LTDLTDFSLGYTASAATISRTVPHRAAAAAVKQDAEAASSSSGDQKAQAEIKALKAELEKQKHKIVEPRASASTSIMLIHIRWFRAY